MADRPRALVSHIPDTLCSSSASNCCDLRELRGPGTGTSEKDFTSAQTGTCATFSLSSSDFKPNMPLNNTPLLSGPTKTTKHCNNKTIIINSPNKVY